jgi:glutamate dehydrogenase/leucine dehydrogenase
MIVEGANIPMREEIEEEFFKKGILVLPDFLVNAGGVISSFAELNFFSKEEAFKLIEKKISETTKEVLKESLKKNISPRKVATILAKKNLFKKTKWKTSSKI